MHRSGTRRADTRNISRVILPPGRALDGEATPLTETTHKPRKSSTKSRPLSSSTNRDVPGPEDGSILPSAPSQWRMGRTTDENDDWILSQEAPPLPLVNNEKPRSRTRTSSAGGSKNKVKSERKPRTFVSQDDTAFTAHSAGLGDQRVTRPRRNTDASSHDSKAHPDSAAREKSSSLRRRISWGRNKIHTEEPPVEESGYKRVSRLGIPEVEKDLVPSLRDTVHRMTGDQESKNEVPQKLPQVDISSNGHAYSAQYSSSLVPPTRYERASSRPNSPLQEPSRAKTRQRSHSSRSPRCNEAAAGDYEPSSHRKADRDAVNDHEAFSKPAGHIETRQARSHSLKAPQTVRTQLSPMMNSDDSAPESALRTPRMRTSSKSRVSPLLSSSTSPARTPSNIPTPKFRSRSSSAATQGEKSPSLPLTLPPKSPRIPDNPRSPVPVPVSVLLEAGANSRTTRDNDKGRAMTRLPSRSPRVYDEDDGEGTPRPSRINRNKYLHSSTETDSSADEKLRFVDRHQCNQTSKLSPNPAYRSAREIRNSGFRYGQRETCGSEGNASDSSGPSASEDLDAGKARNDAHRRKNELAAIVAGLNLDLGPQHDDRASVADHPRRNSSRYQSEESGHQQVLGIAVGGSSESVAVKDRPKTGKGFNDSIQKRHESGQRERHVGPSSRRICSEKRLSSTPRLDTASPENAGSEGNNLLRPATGNVNRDSLLMLSSERQREAFGIPPSVSSMRNDVDTLSSGESNTSLKNQALESAKELEANDELNLSHGAEQLFNALGIGADAQYAGDHVSRKERASWRSSMAEAEKYLSENICPGPGAMSASSSASSIYEDDVPERPWQKREKDLDRVQKVSGSSVKSSWKKTLSHSAFVSLLDRHGEIEMRRQEVIWELCETEQAFLRSLRTALKTFVNPLLGKNRKWVLGLPNNVSRLFDWLEDIFQLHAQISSALQQARSSQYPIVLRIAETLRGFVSRLEVYQPYIVRLDEVVEEIEDIMKDSSNELGEFFRVQSSGEECAGMSFSAFLWLPLTRLGRYLKYFNELWTLTPRSHVDHLATFSLLHSATMVVRVMREVKLREEEYAFVKDLLSRIHGFANLTRLVRRERRLIAHGALQRVRVSERTKELLEGTSLASKSCRTERHRTKAQSSQRRRANSLDSCLSEAASMSSICSAASGFSLDQDDHAQYKFRSSGAVGKNSRRPDQQFASRASAKDTRHERSRTSPLYAFVFTDLAIFTSMIPRDSPDKKNNQALELLDDIGICRVLSVADHSGDLGYDHLIGVQVLPMDMEELEKGLLSDASATSLFVHLPNSGSSMPGHTEATKRWWLAFEQCYHFTLRSISFPAHSGKYLGIGTDAAQDENTRQTVMSILASGLPLPKSPSVQIEELEKNAAQDASLREREERGWWALRFQQILQEMQRDELPLYLLQKPSAMPAPTQLSRRKTVTGRRRLKLASGRK